jgi:UDP-N-acetyl-2-amino-2-deoxyglucuronate dehydrogenase
MDRLGIGIIGCGAAAQDVSRAIDAIPEIRLAATYDRDTQSAVQLAERHGGKVHGSLDEFFGDRTVDLVYVALPHYLLASFAERALRADRHVLVEKPMALDDDVARRLGCLAENRDRRLGVFFPLREAAIIREGRRLVSAGAIGDVRGVRIRTIIDKPSTYWEFGMGGRTADGWRGRLDQAGGGVVLMNSIHQLDALRYITGLSYVRVVAEIATLGAGVDVEDTASAVLRLSNGGLVNLAACAHSPGARSEERISIDGEIGRIDLPAPLGGGAVRLFLRRRWQDYPAEQWIDVPTADRDCYVETVRSFVGAVQAGAKPSATAADAAAALSAVLGIYESARTGRAIVPRSD